MSEFRLEDDTIARQNAAWEQIVNAEKNGRDGLVDVEGLFENYLEAGSTVESTDELNEAVTPVEIVAMEQMFAMPSLQPSTSSKLWNGQKARLAESDTKAAVFQETQLKPLTPARRRLSDLPFEFPDPSNRPTQWSRPQAPIVPFRHSGKRHEKNIESRRLRLMVSAGRLAVGNIIEKGRNLFSSKSQEFEQKQPEVSTKITSAEISWERRAALIAVLGLATLTMTESAANDPNQVGPNEPSPIVAVADNAPEEFNLPITVEQETAAPIIDQPATPSSKPSSIVIHPGDGIIKVVEQYAADHGQKISPKLATKISLDLQKRFDTKIVNHAYRAKS